MRRYETFVIIDPELSQDQREPLIGRVEELVSQMGGFLVLIDDWGERKLAYDIRKKGRGYYVRFDYCGLAPLVNEIERFFRIDDRALKYMTVLLNGDADLEKIKAEKAAKEAAAADTAAAETAAVEADLAGKPNDLDDAPQEEPEKELAPAEEKAKIDEDLPSLETDDASAEKAPTSTKEEA
ncbi:MAG: 30S ribosomal protein S6 [Desulfobacteraceae bacterium]|jgi:small subunit ribosomal protein S6|nr:30S ribosomal protein S6 [Desulfobacteraceae bacterium]